MTRSELVDDLPADVTFAVENVLVEADQIDDDEMKENLAKFGYDRIDISFSTTWSWDRDAEQASFGPIKLDLAEMGSVTAAFTVGGVTRELIDALEDEDRIFELAQMMSLVSLDYSFQDDSLTNRVIGAIADESDLSANTMIGIWVDLSRRQMMDQDIPEDFIDMVTSAFETFLRDPGRLSLAANPDEPIPVTQLMGSVWFGPAALIPLLNISVSAE